MKINCENTSSVRFGRASTGAVAESVGEQQPRIVGGIEAVKNEFPWQARLLSAEPPEMWGKIQLLL